MRARIGSSVLYYSAPAAEPLAAVVTRVWMATVNLTVFPSAELPFVVQHIPHMDDADPDGPCWQWPALTDEGGP